MADKTTKIIEIEVELQGGEKVTKQFEQLSDGTLKAVDSAKKLNDTLDDTAKANDEVNKSFDKGSTFAERYGEELQPLTTRMGEAEDRLYELALAGDTTSQEYQQLLEKVGEYRRTQIQTDLVVDAAATTFTQSLGGALVGVTSGFAALQGAIGLFKTESEELNAALLKVQSSLALAQGVAGVQDAIPAFQKLGKTIITKVVSAFSTLKKALITTGIGAFVVTVALVADALDLFADKVDEAAEAQKRLAKENERLSESFSRRQKFLTGLNDSFAKQRKFEIEQLKAQGASREEIYDKELFAKKEQLEGLIELEQEADAEFKRISKISGDEDFKQYDAALENASRFTKLRIEKERELKLFEINSLKERQQANKDYADKRLEIARQIEDIELDLLEDGVEKEVKISNVKFERLIEDTKKNTEITAKERKRLNELFLKQQQAAELEIRKTFTDKANAEIDRLDKEANEKRIAKEDAIFQLELSLMKDRQLAEIIALTQQYDKKFLLAKDNAELTKQLEEQQKKDIAAIEDRFRKEKEAKDKAARDKTIADNKAELDSRLQMTNDAFGAISGLVTALAKDNEESQEKAFKINKAISIAQAVINTAGAITAAINPAVGGLGIPAGLPGAALAAATGVAQVATIAKTKFEGGGGGVDAPATSVEAQAPQFNVVGDSGVNQLAQLQQQPTQAFVVSGEVTTAQALDRNRVQNATL